MEKSEFYKKWLNAFASDIPDSDIKKYVVSTGDYIWHIFSWELLDENEYLRVKKQKRHTIRKTKAMQYTLSGLKMTKLKI